MNGTQSFFRDKVALVTGASSGIGEELALQLSQSGAKLTLAARRKVLLEKLAQHIASTGKPTPLVVQCDVAQDADLHDAVAETVSRWGKLDVVIANAGFGVVGPFKKLSVGDYRRQFETNVFGVLVDGYSTVQNFQNPSTKLSVFLNRVSGVRLSPGPPAFL